MEDSAVGILSTMSFNLISSCSDRVSIITGLASSIMCRSRSLPSVGSSGIRTAYAEKVPPKEKGTLRA